MSAVSYLLAHECHLLMHSLEQLLRAAAALSCAGRFASGNSLLRALPSSEAKSLVLESALPGAQISETLVAIQSAQPDLRIIIFCSSDCSHLDSLPLIAGGVSAILGSDATPGEFQEAMRRRKQPEPKKALLTEKETEILLLICQENTSQEIAEHCCLSLRTIEGIRRMLLEKTGSRCTAGLVAYAFRNKLFR